MKYREPKMEVLQYQPLPIVTLSQVGGADGGDNTETGSWGDWTPDGV